MKSMTLTWQAQSFVEAGVWGGQVPDLGGSEEGFQGAAPEPSLRRTGNEGGGTDCGASLQAGEAPLQRHSEKKQRRCARKLCRLVMVEGDCWADSGKK